MELAIAVAYVLARVAAAAFYVRCFRAGRKLPEWLLLLLPLMTGVLIGEWWALLLALTAALGAVWLPDPETRLERVLKIGTVALAIVVGPPRLPPAWRLPASSRRFLCGAAGRGRARRLLKEPRFPGSWRWTARARRPSAGTPLSEPRLDAEPVTERGKQRRPSAERRSGDAHARDGCAVLRPADCGHGCPQRDGPEHRGQELSPPLPGVKRMPPVTRPEAR